MKKIIIKTFIILNFILFSSVVRSQDLTHFRQNKSSFSGSITTTGGFYNASGIIPRRDPFNGVITGNFNINLKGFDMPFSFVYSNQNKSFRQPFNQFGLSPKYKWATLHLGYRNVKFSKYVLGSHTFFGIGTELNPGKFRFGFIYGKLKKATNKAVNIFHPQNDTLSDYNRKMISLKLGLGSPKNYFDINILRAMDDSTSVSDEFKQKGIFPEANLVAGINGKLTIAKNIIFHTEVAYSIYTDNQNSKIDFDLPESINKIIPVNISTKGSLAIETKLNYHNKKGFNIGLNYKRIDPEYRSMGIYYINNDLENYTLKTGFRALKNKMQISGSIGLEHNNLKTVRKATTYKTIGSVNVNYTPSPKFGITANYSNYSINQQDGRIQIADSIKLYQTNGTLMLSPHYSFTTNNQKMLHFITFTYMQMSLTDKNQQSIYSNNFTTVNNILSYNLSLAKTGWSFITSFTYNQIKMSFGNSSNTGITFSVNKHLKKPKISFGLQVNYMKNESEQQTINTLSPMLNLNARLGKHHQIRLKTNLILRNNNQLDVNTTEQFGDIRYIFTF
jgi:hypothetical protein